MTGADELRIDPQLVTYINLKLAALGCPTVANTADTELTEMIGTLLQRHRETDRLLSNYLSPADNRIQTFLYDYLQDATAVPKLPARSFALDRAGLARALSLPPDRDDFSSEIIQSYRVKQGVLHNPKSDRRTTKGIFHVAEGGLPIPDDKKSVPKGVFGNLLRLAFSPPAELLRLPFTSSQPQQAECFVSLLLRPIVCPEVPGHSPEKTMEVRFFVPGSLVSNLDFVESIFGNAGDPYLPQNDAGLDAEHWTGHTGCVVLATHLTGVTKKAAGLPHYDQATERQQRDGMCWKEEGEFYNDGEAFKVTARDASGVIVTVIADNYFGYCKKEVKTQISFSANLFGGCEEEHAGGAYVYPSYDLGEEFSGGLHVRSRGHTFDEVVKRCGAAMEVKPEGYAVDKRYPEIIYVPEHVFFDLHSQRVSWQGKQGVETLKLLPDKIYVRPSGYYVRMEKPPGLNRAWRLVGTLPEPTTCHKPCTVSGGGKSEISKAITDSVLTGPVFVADFQKDFDQVAELIARDYSDRFKDKRRVDRRPVLSAERSLGSVIKLLTPAMREYKPEYNEWLETIPQYLKELVFVVKRYYKPEWGKDWRSHFSVDIINGTPGNELKCDNRKLVTTYLRVGYAEDGLWRTFGLRKDFHPAAKIQAEDDITATVVVPSKILEHLPPDMTNQSVKLMKNCEQRLFQRPDEAIHRGYDKQTESDFSRPDNFLSNYEPLTPQQARELVEDSLNFDRYTPAMQRFIRDVAETGKPTFFVSTAHPRLVDGKPTKNPRYLQPRPDLVNARDAYLAEMATRLARRMPLAEAVLNPVTAVLPGRRNNPPDPEGGIRPLAVYNPIHYMELPELFMEFICSMTGKSPSTTGAGSEGAMTKGPFNALPPIIDLNAALVSHVLTGHNGFVTAAGYVGPQARFDHDISLIIPEIWCRMTAEERDPGNLIKEGCLEKCQDFDFNGERVLASRLGYRITARFVRSYFARMFNHPHQVLTEMMLKPEMQDMSVFADGMENIVTTQKRVAAHYFNDGSIEWACPPLRALLHIMVNGHFEGKGLGAAEVRSLFTREHVLASDWYGERLKAKQGIDTELWQRHAAYLEKFLTRANYAEEAERLGIRERLKQARARLTAAKSPSYVEELHGTIGVEPKLRGVFRLSA
jgi:phosphoenolpyruvate carboxykinase (diphosphate)